MTSQWERLLKNTGTWVGSFTQLSPQGAVLNDLPTQVTLQPGEDGKLMRQEIRKYPPDAPPQETILEYRSLNRSTLFFETGAFSQGSLQWGPFSEFGAELGLIASPQRLRLVQLFNQDRQLSQLTLIREHLAGTTPSARPPLTIAALVGTWQGEAVTLYADLRPGETNSTQLQISCQGDQVEQVLQIGNTDAPMRSAGTVMGDRILFESGPQTVQVLLLPDGASATCPVQIESRTSVFLEAGWLIAPDHRQRLIRRYSAQGTWESLTLVTEHRLA